MKTNCRLFYLNLSHRNNALWSKAKSSRQCEGSILPTCIRNILWTDELESHELDYHIMVTNTKKVCRLFNLNLSHLNNALYMSRKAKRIRGEVKDRSQLHNLVKVYSAHCTMVATTKTSYRFFYLNFSHPNKALCMLKKTKRIQGRERDWC